MSGILYLIPSPIGSIKEVDYLTQSNTEILQNLKYFIVESEKTARAFLHYCGHNLDDNLNFIEYNEHNFNKINIDDWLKILKSNNSIGLISEAGTPCIADPGSEIVLRAHLNDIEVYPFAIPSSITMALMSSGLNGQKFSFHGYLDKNVNKLRQQIKILERESRLSGYSQIFMEVPYKSQKIFDLLLNTLKSDTFLCIAAELNTSEQFIKTKQIKSWKNFQVELNKKRCIFIFQNKNYF